MEEKKLLFIVNPRAGRNKTPRPAVRRALAVLSAAGYLVRIHQTTAPGDAAEAAAREGGQYDLVVAPAGDGTPQRGDLRHHAAGRAAAWDIFPRAPPTTCASCLGISRDPWRRPAPSSGDRLAGAGRGDVEPAELRLRGSFGAFTRSSYAASQAAKNALGHFAYILEGMKDLSTLRPYHVRLTADGDDLEGRLPLRRRVQLHLHPAD